MAAEDRLDGEPFRPADLPLGGLWAGSRKPWPNTMGVHEVRRALLLPVGARWRVRTRVPPKGALRFELTLLPQGKALSSVRLTLTGQPRGGAAQVLLERTLAAPAVGVYLPVRVELGALAGKDVTFEVTIADARPAGAARGGAGGDARQEAAARAAMAARSSVVALARPVIEGEGPAGPLNVVLLILDTVRIDALGVYGQARVRTPALDALAARGVRFTSVFSNAPWTRPSLMSLLSSRHPGQAGATPTSFYPHDPDVAHVRSGVVSTLPDHLEHQGYRVRALAQNYFMLPHERVGTDHGFSSFAHVLLPGGPHRAENPTLTAAAERFLADHRNHRFFFYLHYESAHAPYNPPREVLEDLRGHLGPKALITIEDKYRGEVMALDRLVARLVAALERNGLMERTLLVVTSDHGETLDRVHCFLLPKLTYNTCFGHSPSLYDEVLHVPLILVAPGLRPGRVVTQLTRHVDLAPTILELLGLPPLPGAEGRSVAPWVLGDRPEEPREVYAVGRGVFALREGGWKYLWRAPITRKRVLHGKEIHVVEELYDLREDPQEHRNLVARRPEVASRMRAALFARMKADRFELGAVAPGRGKRAKAAPRRRLRIPAGVAVP